MRQVHGCLPLIERVQCESGKYKKIGRGEFHSQFLKASGKYESFFGLQVTVSLDWICQELAKLKRPRLRHAALDLKIYLNPPFIFHWHLKFLKQLALNSY